MDYSAGGMIDFHYVGKGLRGLSQAYRANGMAGHLGSAVLAGYLFSEDHPEAEGGVFLGVERDLERIMAGEETVWFDPEKSGVTIPEMFSSLDEKDQLIEIQKDPAGRVAAALEKSVGPLRQSGHNVIFASIAIRTLQSHPGLGDAETLGGIERLLATFDKASEGRGYFGKESGWKQGGKVDLAEVEPVSCPTVATAADIAIGELIADGAKHTMGFGGLIHLLDHAAALVELDRSGYGGIASRALPGLERHVGLLRSLPVLDDELGPLRAAEIDPLKTEYWSKRDSVQYSAWLTHRIKVLYAYGVVSSEIDEEDRLTAAWNAFRYLMA